MKEKIKNNKFLWIGGIMGILQQALGELHQEDKLINLTQIMGGIGIYAAIIMLIIFRDKPPEEQRRDILLFFIGLDLFYYLYVIIKDAIIYFILRKKRHAVVFFANTLFEMAGFVYWTGIGAAAAVWAYFATKFRNDNKKIPYMLMLAPLFIAILWEFTDSTRHMVLYIMQQPENQIYRSSLIFLLTDMVCLAISIKAYIKKRVPQ